MHMRYRHHCTPVMKTKLESMPKFKGIASLQDGLGLINVYFEQDNSKQRLVEIVDVDTCLMLY